MIVPYHNHTFSGTAKSYTSGTDSANHTHSGTTSSSGSHTHGAALRRNDAGNLGITYAGSSAWGAWSNLNVDAGGDHIHTMTTGGVSNWHTHTTTVTPEGNISYAGSANTNANMPAYYTCYIWRRVS